MPYVGGTVASWLPSSTPERAVRVRALAWNIVLCSWVRHSTLTGLFPTQVYKWVPVNCWGNLTNCGKVTCDGVASRPGEVEILLAASCYRNWDNLRQLWTRLDSKASLYDARIKIPEFHAISYPGKKRRPQQNLFSCKTGTFATTGTRVTFPA